MSQLVVLQTGLFRHADVISSSVVDEGVSVEFIDLTTERPNEKAHEMNEKEWDEVLERILLAQRVITL